jgi:hypothetical protein
MMSPVDRCVNLSQCFAALAATTERTGHLSENEQRVSQGPGRLKDARHVEVVTSDALSQPCAADDHGNPGKKPGLTEA